MDKKKIYESKAPFVVRGADAIIAESRNAILLAEAGQPDRVFFPRGDVAMALFEPSQTWSKDPILGKAHFFHLEGQAGKIDDVAWCYCAPDDGLDALAGHMTFDTGKVVVEAL